MCDICRQSICPSGCPNAPWPTVYARCDECGAKIYVGYEFYEIGDHKFCENCVRDGYKIAEVE